MAAMLDRHIRRGVDCMPSYSQDEMYAAATGIVQAITKLNERLDRVEAQPANDAFAKQFQRGRQLARSQGLSSAQLEALEQRMVEEGISRHEYALRLFPTGSGGGMAPMNMPIEKDEWEALIAGDDRLFESLAIPRALKAAREDYY
jgi:hypothetical protein